jgi:hypothetical protein
LKFALKMLSHGMTLFKITLAALSSVTVGISRLFSANLATIAIDPPNRGRHLPRSHIHEECRRTNAEHPKQEQQLLRRMDPEQCLNRRLRHPSLHRHVSVQGVLTLVHGRGHGRDGVHRGGEQHERPGQRGPGGDEEGEFDEEEETGDCERTENKIFHMLLFLSFSKSIIILEFTCEFDKNKILI